MRIANPIWILAGLVLSCPSLTAADVTVRPLQGEPLQGAVVALNENEVTLQTASGPQTLKSAALNSVKLNAAPTPLSDPPTGIRVELVDESSFLASQFTLVQGKARIKLLEGPEITVEARSVGGVRFQKPDDGLNNAWHEIATADRAGDVLVVRKVSQPAADSAQSPTVVLDQLEGIVHEIGENTIVFEFDGDRLEVARTKLEGILFRNPAEAATAEPKCRVKDLAGGTWNVQSMKFAENRVQFTTVAGATAELPVSNLLEIDYSAANIVYLSDLEPESAEWRPYFHSPATPSSLNRWFQPKRDQGVDGLPMTLRGESFEKGLALHSRTVVSYRLTKSYQRFIATVGVDDRFRTTANLLLVVSGDDRPLLTRNIKGDEEPFELALDTKDVRRLKILVDFGEDRSDAGDLLYFCNARLVK